MSERKYDVVLHGATGFVGRLTARHLAARAGSARIALSGRSEDKLAALKRELAVDWPLLVTDAADRASVDRLARSTTAVATTVGPYSRYGMPLVLACAESGTSYADLSGELPFVRASAEQAHDTAVASGARIVHAAGFDSIPSDLGTLLLAERVRADGEGTLGETVLVLVSAKGGFSGGTIDSMRGLLQQVREDPSLKKILADPYGLSPDRGAEPDHGPERDLMVPSHDALLDRWVAPFIMGPYNSRIVRRSNALSGHSYGPDFRYREVMGVGRGPLAPVLAAGVTAGLAAFGAGMTVPVTRSLLDRVLPKPGSGPSEKAQRGGHFRVEVHTRTSTGARYVATVAAKGDPGYAATAVMLGESVLSLGLDALTSPAGVVTPAVALGDTLPDRLRSNDFEVSVARSE